jgi:hypothetical protein
VNSHNSQLWSSENPLAYCDNLSQPVKSVYGQRFLGSAIAQNILINCNAEGFHGVLMQFIDLPGIHDREQVADLRKFFVDRLISQMSLTSPLNSILYISFTGPSRKA